MIDLSKIDKTKFTTDGYVKRVEKPWGYELHFVQEDKPYMGKILHINANCRLSMQVHDQKQETYLLNSGEAKIIWENNKGELVETILTPGKGYTTLIGQRHRLCGITDCDIIEFSTPEKGTTLRLEDDYKRPDETPEQRKIERGEK
jgi:mannose-6-phosphate isomerase-like protein (cupin superfamily)